MKKNYILLIIGLALILLLPVLTKAETHDGTGKIYVKEGGAGTKDGSSWANATGNLQAAINASGVTQVWVAAGTYGGATIIMKNGVAMYGGFPNTGDPDMDNRDWGANATILTGNNTRRVIQSTDGAAISSATILDGFIIENGKVTGSSGGGLRFYGTHPNYPSPTLRNLIIRNNTTNSNGGGMYVGVSTPVLINVVFVGNSADKGGAIYFNQSNSKHANLTITGNRATTAGGAIYVNEYSRVLVNNSIIWGNTKADGVTVDNIGLLTNVSSNTVVHTNNLVEGCINSGNWVSAVGYNGGDNAGFAGNIDGNPLFIGVADFRLQSTSPAKDAGKNSLYTGAGGLTTDKDLAGNPRVINTTIDMGAYEYQGTLPVSLISFTAKADGNRAKLQWQTASESNNKGFEVWRKGEGGKVEGLEFVKIGEVKASHISNLTSQIYSYTDNTPLNGNNYYKLVQVNNDGTATGLDVRTVTFRLQPSILSLYPNPTENQLTVAFGAGRYSQLQLADINGKVLQSVAINNTENSKTLAIAAYPAGIYIIKLLPSGEDLGGAGTAQTEIKKVVKK